MKLTLLALVLTAGSVFGTTIQITTGGATGVNIFDNAGAPVTGAGFAAIGVYNGPALTAGSSTGADLAAAFTIGTYVSTSSQGPQVPLVHYGPTFGQERDGFNINNITKASAAGNLGANVAVVIWKGGSDLSTATEAIVFQFNQLYEAGATPVVLQQGSSAGTLQFGTSRTQMALLGVIPEPSSALLLGLGGLGLLVRRRR